MPEPEEHCSLESKTLDKLYIYIYKHYENIPHVILWP